MVQEKMNYGNYFISMTDVVIIAIYNVSINLKFIRIIDIMEGQNGSKESG